MPVENELNRMKKINDIMKKDVNEGLRQLQLWADEGSFSAKNMLGMFYKERDPQMALKYFRDVAENDPNKTGIDCQNSKWFVFWLNMNDPSFTLTTECVEYRYLCELADLAFDKAIFYLVCLKTGWGNKSFDGRKLFDCHVSTGFRDEYDGLKLLKKIDGKIDNSYQRFIDLIKAEAKEKYGAIYSAAYGLPIPQKSSNGYYGSNQIDNNYSGYEEQRGTGCSNILLLIAAFMFPVIGMIFAIMARKRGSGVLSIIAMGYNAIFILLFLLAIITN